MKCKHLLNALANNKDADLMIWMHKRNRRGFKTQEQFLHHGYVDVNDPTEYGGHNIVTIMFSNVRFD